MTLTSFGVSKESTNTKWENKKHNVGLKSVVDNMYKAFVDHYCKERKSGSFWTIDPSAPLPLKSFYLCLPGGKTTNSTCENVDTGTKSATLNAIVNAIPDDVYKKKALHTLHISIAEEGDPAALPREREECLREELRSSSVKWEIAMVECSKVRGGRQNIVVDDKPVYRKELICP